MGNQGCIYLVMFGSRSWLNFSINPYHCFVLDCVCKVFWWVLVLFICLTRSSVHAKHPYCMALLLSVTHACHCSVALISLSQSSLLLLPAITDWLDSVTHSQIQSQSLLQKQIHSEMTLNLVVLSLCLEWRPYGSIWQCLSEAPYVISASRLWYSFE